MFTSADANSVEITVNITGLEMYTLVHVVLISLLHDSVPSSFPFFYVLFPLPLFPYIFAYVRHYEFILKFSLDIW